MTLVSDRISSFLQEDVPRAQRTVTADEDPVERYFDLAAYYGDPRADVQVLVQDDHGYGYRHGRGSSSGSSPASSYYHYSSSSPTRTGANAYTHAYTHAASAHTPPGLMTDSATSPSVLSDSSAVEISAASSPPSSSEETRRGRGGKRGAGAGHKSGPAVYRDGSGRGSASSSSSSRGGGDDGSYPGRKNIDRFVQQDDSINWSQTAVATQRMPLPGPPHIASFPSRDSKRKSRRSSSPAARQVKNPVETAQIRKVGACIKCRIEKLKCSDGGICHSCDSKYGPSLCQSTCLRKTLTEIARPTTWVRYTGLSYERERTELRTRCVPDRSFQEVLLSFSDRDPHAPTLSTIFQQCRSAESDTEVIAFPRERIPLHEELVKWAERQVAYERNIGLATGFESSIENFVMCYAKAGSSMPQISLLKKIHQMSCMYRIWKMGTLFWRRSQGGRSHRLPPFIQAELRQIVRKALESAERDIVAELDKFLKPSGIPSKDRAPMWAGLWQLIFIWRDMNETFREAETQASYGRGIDVHPDFQACKSATEQLFIAVLCFYGSHYRQASNLQASLHGLDSTHVPSSSLRRQIDEAFRATRLHRSSFHDAIRSSPRNLDRLIKTLVVDHEVKRLRRGRGNGRAKPQVLAVASSPEIFDSDDDIVMLG